MRVGIVGLGNFGRFWADVLKRDHTILGTDVSPARCRSADRAVADLATVCAESEAVFLCVPISALEDVVQAVASLLHAGQVIFDVCSIKVHPVEVMTRHLTQVEGLHIIATHPLFGPQSAADGLTGLPIMMHPLRTAPEVYDTWWRYFAGLGLRVVEISPDEHDRLAAYSQGVTHYMGRVLGEMDLRATPIDTRGFETLLALIYYTCNDTWQLFRDLQTYNPYAAQMRLRLEAALRRIYDNLLPDEVEPGRLVVGAHGVDAATFLDHAPARDLGDLEVRPLGDAEAVLLALHAGEVDRAVLTLRDENGDLVAANLAALGRHECEVEDLFEAGGCTFAWLRRRTCTVRVDA